MKQIEAQIMGQTYMLTCPQGMEDAMRHAITRVDTAMSKIRDAGKIRARDRIAVLAALNIAFDMYEHERMAPAASAPTATNSDHTASTTGQDALIHPRMQQLQQRMEKILAKDGMLL